jgi:type VI secretion system protein ImpC
MSLSSAQTRSDTQSQTTDHATSAAQWEEDLLSKTKIGRSDTDKVREEISALLEEALKGQVVLKGRTIDTLEAMVANIDKMLTAQINEILHTPAFQELESAWRGLHYLVHNTESDTQLKIKVMNVSKRELSDMFRLYPGVRWDQSPLFNLIYTQEYGMLGGHPYGCIIGDYSFNHENDDMRVLEGMSKIAAASHAPFFAAAASSMLGMDSWNEIGDPAALARIFELPEYVRWRAFRDSEDSCYVGLCMPRVMARLPYGEKGEPVREFAFEEETDGYTGEKYSWMNAAYGMATNITRAFKEYGWAVQIRGVESGGTLFGLPTDVFKTDDGGTDMKCPSEVSIDERRDKELSDLGFMPLIHRRNTNQATFIGGQSVFRPKKFRDPDATSSSHLRSRIPYMFAVSRFAHYLKVMVRDKIGTLTSRQEMERYLSNWIMDYVHAAPNGASYESKAKLPLAEARVEVFEDEENPGYYAAKFYLRPHFQLEGVDIALGLVARMPKQAS